MIIDWIYGLVGGLFIGLGGLVLLIFNGRIMGASGILGQLIDGKQDTENIERIVFLIGVITAPLIILQFSIMKIYFMKIQLRRKLRESKN